MTRRLQRCLSFAAVALGVIAPLLAADDRPEKPPAKDERPADMDYGPFLSTSVVRGAANKPYQPKALENPNGPKFPVDPIPDAIALKGIVIPVGEKATICFDTDTLRMAAGWTDGWLDLTGTMLTNHKGTSHVTLAGQEQFRCGPLGWGGGPKGEDFSDPRPERMGPLPPDRARYRGLYVNGRQVVLSYQVGGAEVLELPGCEWNGDAAVFTRTFRVEKSGRPLTLAVCDESGARGARVADNGVATLEHNGRVTSVGAVRLPPGAALRPAEGHIRLSLPPLDGPAVFKVAITGGDQVDAPSFAEWLKQSPPPVDPKPLCSGGAARWKPLDAKGQPAGPSRKNSDGAYVSDTLTLPHDNPWHSWLRLSGLDFFSDGRAVVCTLNGDVWVVSGIDEKLEKLTWTRFATGLYHPMGLCVVGDNVYVRGRDQITRLHDLNGDGEADFYENFNNEGMAHPSYHGFVFDLQADAAGNFYYARGGIGMATDLPGQGRLIRVSKDGSTVTTLATGLRAPNGLGVFPGAADGGGAWVTVSDNQGNWIPSSKIHAIDPAQPPQFLGFLPHHHLDKPPEAHAAPLCWIPHKLDNSSGGQAVVAGDKWGPFQRQWVHTSFGAASLMLLLPDARGGDGEKAAVPKQAAVVRLPLDFDTGVMRPRFNPRDGQLYVCGVGGGWQTKGTRDGGLYRVRYTGKPTHLPTSFRVVPGGIRLTFATPLDRASAADVENWGGEQWSYVWTEKYGSPEFSAKTPAKPGRDEVEIKSVTVSEDGKTVTLNIPDLKPVMQMVIQYNLKAADGTELDQELYATVNQVPPR